jgi:hypothetical protein
MGYDSVMLASCKWTVVFTCNYAMYGRTWPVLSHPHFLVSWEASIYNFALDTPRQSRFNFAKHDTQTVADSHRLRSPYSICQR